MSRASTVWDAITPKYWSNDAFSQRKKALTLWFWICRFWIHGEARICWELSSVTLCCKYCLLWQRTSAPTSGSGRLRVLLRPKPRAFGLGGRPNRCPRISTPFTSVGKWGKSPGRQQQRNVGCPLLPSVIGQRFTKKSSCCRWSPLQEYIPLVGCLKAQNFLFSLRKSLEMYWIFTMHRCIIKEKCECRILQKGNLLVAHGETLGL